MHTFYTRFLLVFFGLFSFYLVHGQIIFEDDFESEQFKSEWTVRANLDGVNGIVGIGRIGSSGSLNVFLGKNSDAGGFTTNALDLKLDLSGINQAELSFSIYDFTEENHPEDGIFFSDNGGATFIKVFSFFPEEWCNELFGGFPPLDLDRLALENGLNLTDRFVIRFQQHDNADFRYSGDEDGIRIDNVSVRETDTEYVTLPFSDNFDNNEFGPMWHIPAFVDSTSSREYAHPHGFVFIQESVGTGSSSAVTFGQNCDGPFTTNALDLHLNLSGISQAELSLSVYDFTDENHPEDGIFFSDDGGVTFTKVFDFYPAEWCNELFGGFPPLDLDRLAQENGLSLTDRFVIRFQQHDNADYRYSGDEDGIRIDNVSVRETDTEYVTLPFSDNFDNNEFGPMWHIPAFVDNTSSREYAHPHGFVFIQESVGTGSSSAVTLGQNCDGPFTTNALDLHLNLSGISQAELSLSVYDFTDENHPEDGIFFSDDGGVTFTKVFDFYPAEWCNELFGGFPPLDLDRLALENGLNLTDKFVIRFQQHDNADYRYSGDEDGIRIDNVSIRETDTEYVTLPFSDNFDSNEFGPMWHIPAFVDNTSSREYAHPHGFVFIQEGVGIGSSSAVTLGQNCDGPFTTNALDLHLNLSGISQAELSLSVYDFTDENHPEDGIFFSDDGGVTFTKVFDFYPAEWCNELFRGFPPLDLDRLAQENGLSLTDRFVIRFQQHDNADYRYSGDEDGIRIDNVSVRETDTEYVTLPFSDNFDSNEFGPMWHIPAFVDSTSSREYAHPHGFVFIQEGVGIGSSSAVTLGQNCDGPFTTNALDLHLNLSGISQAELSLSVYDFTDENHPEDGIFFSDDGGVTFTKVFDFYPAEWCNELFGGFPPLDLDRLAQENGLSLTDRFVIRFQQHDNADYRYSGDEDGIRIDNVSVRETDTEYVTLPFSDNFDSNEFGPMWHIPAFVDSTSSREYAHPHGFVFIQERVGTGSSSAVTFGQNCDGPFTTNALDLHLNLSGISQAELSLSVYDFTDENHPEDGIFFSDDGGITFEKVYDFLPASWPNEVYTNIPPLEISRLALENGLSLTDRFVIRFQQHDNADYRYSGDEDGIRIDNILIKSTNEVLTWYQDSDGDSFGNNKETVESIIQPSGYVLNNTDCDDNNLNITFIGASCNDGDDTTDNDIVKEDCSCSGDDIAIDPNNVDNDGDGFTENENDCDDMNPNINPNAEEISGNEVDENCDGIIQPIINGKDTICNLGDGLIAHYDFNGNANDISGNGNNGVIEGPTLTTDRFGKEDGAYLFDGLDDFISVTSSASLESTNEGYAITSWVLIDELYRSGSFNWGIILSKQRQFASILYSGGGFSTCNEFLPTANPLPLDKWMYVAISYDREAGVFSAYIDGELVTIPCVNPVINQNDLLIGLDPFGVSEFLNGTIDDIRIYNRPLSLEEIQDLEGCNSGIIIQPDRDEDGIADATDNCIEIQNPNQVDLDNDGAGTACDCDDTEATGADCTDGCQYFYFDNDGDTFGGQMDSVLACVAPTGYVNNRMDCDDEDINKNIGGTCEVCTDAPILSTTQINTGSNETRILFENDFENPDTTQFVEFCSPDLILNNTIKAIYGFEFNQTFTIETIRINGPNNDYADPQRIGGDYALGLLKGPTNDDMLAFTFNRAGLPFLNLKMNISPIGWKKIGACRNQAFELKEPVFKVSVYDTPSGNFNFSTSNVLLDSKEFTGLEMGETPFVFNWAIVMASLDVSDASSESVTVVLDLIESDYAAFDNITITSSSQVGSTGDTITVQACETATLTGTLQSEEITTLTASFGTITQNGNNWTWTSPELQTEDSQTVTITATNDCGMDEISFELVVEQGEDCPMIECDFTEGLAAYYPLNGNANDESGNEINGAERGGVTYGIDRFGNVGQSAVLNGSNGYVDFEDNLDVGTNDYALSFWFNADEFLSIPTGSKIINKGLTMAGTPSDAGFGIRIRQEDNGDNILLFLNSSNGERFHIETNGLSTDTWYHVFAQRVDTTLTLFINGALKNSRFIPATANLDTDIPLAIGALHRGTLGATSEYYNGSFDDFRFYQNQPFSNEEVSKLYECEKGDNPPPPPCNDILTTQTFTSQSLLDSFVCDCNKIIEGDLIINGDDINDLSNLSCIKEVTGNVYIGDSLSIPSNDILQTLDGLSGMMKIGGDLVICNNPALINLDGFSSLMEVGGDIQVKNCRVIEYIRFVSLTRVGGSCIYLNLPTLRFIGSAEFGIFGGFGLTSFGGGVRYENLPELVWITGFDGISEIRGDLYFINVPKLQSLEAYRRIIRLFGCLHLIETTQIVDFSGLDSLELIGEDIRIMNNDQIRDLSQLGNLVTLNGSIIIMNNANLQDLNGLRNLVSVADTLKITGNPMLDNCCGINDLLRNNGVGGPVLISDNLAGCLSEVDINDNCTDEDGDGFSAIDDCNDNNPDIYPGATELLCDGIDSNCNGADECPPFECPELMANKGDACDDGMIATINDTIDMDCNCVGMDTTMVAPPFECPELMANKGDACDDGKVATINDTIDMDCNCVGMDTTMVAPPFECLELMANKGDACDDGMIATINDTIDMDCNCVGMDTTTTTDPDFCIEFNAYVGSPCDDNDPNTEDEWLEEGCKCVGQVINGCNAIITVRDNTITVEEVNGARIKVHLYDRTFSNAINTNCDYWNDCEGTQTFENLLPGVYAVQYQSFNDDWTNIYCDSVVYVEIVAPTSQNDCQDIDIKITGNTVTFDNFPTLNTIVDIYDPNFRSMFNCIGDCGTSQVVENLPAGDYLIRFKVYDAGWNFVCEREEHIEIAAAIAGDSEEQEQSPTINPTTGRSTEIVVDKLTTYPNPTAESINVEMNSFMNEGVTITLTDRFGRVLQKHQLDKVNDAVFTMNIRDYPAGVYQIMAFGNGQLLTTKVIVLR